MCSADWEINFSVAAATEGVERNKKIGQKETQRTRPTDAHLKKGWKVKATLNGNKHMLPAGVYYFNGSIFLLRIWDDVM